MGLIEQQNFIARLYTGSKLRDEFLSVPASVGKKYNLSEDEIAEISQVLPEELNLFAEMLVGKRLHEVEKILPLTKEILKDDFTKQFRIFSQNFNPQSVNKHLEDAIGFCRFLQTCEVSPLAKNASEFELVKLEFFSLEKRFSFCLLDYDLKNFKKRKNFYYWLRIGGRIYRRTL